jgi:hypothetical protein
MNWSRRFLTATLPQVRALSLKQPYFQIPTKPRFIRAVLINAINITNVKSLTLLKREIAHRALSNVSATDTIIS